jgi:hypothetical protein
MKSAFDWIVSVMAGRWLVLAWLAVSLACLATSYGYGRSHANARWEARWEAQHQADAVAAAVAQAAADDRLKRQKQATIDAATRFQHEQVENVRLAGLNAVLSERLRAAVTKARRDPVPAAPADPGTPEPPAHGELSVPVELVVSGLVEFSGHCARSRDDLAAQVAGLLDAWPR